MPRIIKKAGDILKFPLSKAGLHGYAQWLPDKTARVFKAACDSELSICEVLALPMAFRVLVFHDTPNRYGWSKIGNAPVPKEHSEPQRYAKRDILSGQLSIYYRGTEVSATLKELKGLETLAVWAHPHIVERLEAQLACRKSKALKGVEIAV